MNFSRISLDSTSAVCYNFNVLIVTEGENYERNM